MVRSTFSRLRTVSENRLSFIFHLDLQGIQVVLPVHNHAVVGVHAQSSSTLSIWLGNTLMPRMMSMSSVRPLGLFMRTVVRPQAHFSWVREQMSRVR